MPAGVPSSFIATDTLYTWSRQALDKLFLTWGIKKDPECPAAREAIIKLNEWSTFAAMNGTPNTSASITNANPDEWEGIYDKYAAAATRATMIANDNESVTNALNSQAYRALTSDEQINYVLKTLPLDKAEKEFAKAVEEVAPYLDDPMSGIADHANALSIVAKTNPKIDALMAYVAEVARAPRAAAVADIPDLFVLEYLRGIGGTGARVNYQDEDAHLHQRVSHAKSIQEANEVHRIITGEWEGITFSFPRTVAEIRRRAKAFTTAGQTRALTEESERSGQGRTSPSNSPKPHDPNTWEEGWVN